MRTRGWVYIIVNKAMKGLIKIGYSNQDPIFRAMDLDNTGSPSKYQVAYDALVDNPYEFEQEMHKLLKENSVGKEWFKYRISSAMDMIRGNCPRIYAEKLDLDLISEIITENDELWRYPAKRKKNNRYKSQLSQEEYDALPDREKEELSETHEQVTDMPDSILEYQEKHKEIYQKRKQRQYEVFEIWEKMTKEEQIQKLIELMQNMTPEIWRSNDHQISHLLKLEDEIVYGEYPNLEALYPDGCGLLDGDSCNTLWMEINTILEISLQKALLKGKKDSNKSD